MVREALLVVADLHDTAGILLPSVQRMALVRRARAWGSAGRDGALHRLVDVGASGETAAAVAARVAAFVPQRMWVVGTPDDRTAVAILSQALAAHGLVGAARGRASPSVEERGYSRAARAMDTADDAAGDAAGDRAAAIGYDLTSDSSERTRGSTAGHLPDGVPHGVPDGVTNHLPDGVPDDLPDGVTNDLPHGVPDDPADDLPDDRTDHVPGGSPEAIPAWLCELHADGAIRLELETEDDEAFAASLVRVVAACREHGAERLRLTYRGAGTGAALPVASRASPFPVLLHDAWRLQAFTTLVRTCWPERFAQWRFLLLQHASHVSPLADVYAGRALRDRNAALLVNIL